MDIHVCTISLVNAKIGTYLYFSSCFGVWSSFKQKSYWESDIEQKPKMAMKCKNNHQKTKMQTQTLSGCKCKFFYVTKIKQT